MENAIALYIVLLVLFVAIIVGLIGWAIGRFL